MFSVILLLLCHHPAMKTPFAPRLTPTRAQGHDTWAVIVAGETDHSPAVQQLLAEMAARTMGDPDFIRRIEIEKVDGDFQKVVISYGFMESPNLPKALGQCRRLGLKYDIMATSFFLGRRSIVPSAQSGMPLWQDHLFIFLMKNAANPTDFFHIPAL